MLPLAAMSAGIALSTAAVGVVLLVGGVLAILLKEPMFDEQVIEWTRDHPVLLPVVLLAGTVVAAFVQQANAAPPPPTPVGR